MLFNTLFNLTDCKFNTLFDSTDCIQLDFRFLFIQFCAPESRLITHEFPGSEFSCYGDVVATNKFGLWTYISTAYTLKEREKKKKAQEKRDDTEKKKKKKIFKKSEFGA